MDTKVLEYIVAIAEERSISRAAERFFLSPSALSQHLKKIEAELGVPLFVREDGKLCLTDIGKIYINGARSILYIEEDAMDRIREMRMDKKNTVRFIVSERSRGSIVRNVLPAAHTRFPELDIKLTSAPDDAVQEYLLNGLADVGIITTDYIAHEQLEICPIHTGEMVLVLPAKNPAAIAFDENGVAWELLSNDYFILNKASDSFRTIQQSALEQAGFYARTLCEVQRLRAALSMVEDGLGVSLLPSKMLDPDSEKYLAFSLNPPVRIYTSIAYPKSTVLNRTIKELMSIVRERFDM